MKKNMLMILAATLLMAGTVEAAPSVTHKTHHKDLACVECHAAPEGKAPPASDACRTCHGPMRDLIKKTAAFKRNPHRSPHWADTVPCYTCHKEHKASELLCATEYCHVKNFEGVTLK